MILRALEIIEHAKVHVARVYLSGDRSIESGRNYLAATRLLEAKGEELERELARMPVRTKVRSFAARRSVGWN